LRRVRSSGRTIRAPASWRACLRTSRPAAGEAVAETIVEEYGVSFFVPMGQGQKTGWFYDQAWNRRSMLK
jgi:23S rRNA G2069 N7-methylase RlmK/C1962 C5-methylase RlmI